MTTCMTSPPSAASLVRVPRNVGCEDSNLRLVTAVRNWVLRLQPLHDRRHTTLTPANPATAASTDQCTAHPSAPPCRTDLTSPTSPPPRHLRHRPRRQPTPAPTSPRRPAPRHATGDRAKPQPSPQALSARSRRPRRSSPRSLQRPLRLSRARRQPTPAPSHRTHFRFLTVPNFRRLCFLALCVGEGMLTAGAVGGGSWETRSFRPERARNEVGPVEASNPGPLQVAILSAWPFSQTRSRTARWAERDASSPGPMPLRIE